MNKLVIKEIYQEIKERSKTETFFFTDKEIRLRGDDGKIYDFNVECNLISDGWIFKVGSWIANFWFTLGAKTIRGFYSSIIQTPIVINHSV